MCTGVRNLNILVFCCFYLLLKGLKCSLNREVWCLLQEWDSKYILSIFVLSKKGAIKAVKKENNFAGAFFSCFKSAGWRKDGLLKHSPLLAPGWLVCSPFQAHRARLLYLQPPLQVLPQVSLICSGFVLPHGFWSCLLVITWLPLLTPTTQLVL